MQPTFKEECNSLNLSASLRGNVIIVGLCQNVVEVYALHFRSIYDIYTHTQ